MNKKSSVASKKIIFILIAVLVIVISFFLGAAASKIQLDKNVEEVFFEHLNIISNRLQDYLTTKEPSHLEYAIYDIAFCEKLPLAGVVIEDDKYNVAYVMRNLGFHLRFGELSDDFIERIIRELKLSYENKTLFYIDANIPIYNGK